MGVGTLVANFTDNLCVLWAPILCDSLERIYSCAGPVTVLSLYFLLFFPMKAVPLALPISGSESQIGE